MEFYIQKHIFLYFHLCFILYSCTSYVAFFFQIDGEPYWFYEYIVRKSPTKNVSSPFLSRILLKDLLQLSVVDSLHGNL
jgi:hypothetical protein